MGEDFVMTPHRAKILTVLLEQGDIHDSDGQSTTLLMDHTGHRTSNALSGVLLAMEQAGLVERDKAGRRTYRIGLTREGRRLAKSLREGQAAAAAVEAMAEDEGDDDYNLVDVIRAALAAARHAEERADKLEAELADVRARLAAVEAGAAAPKPSSAPKISRRELAELRGMVQRPAPSST